MFKPDYWPPTEIIITADANNQPIAHFVIHELLHVIFSPMFHGVDETLEEVIVVALDQYMYEYVKKSKARLAKWDALIEKKLAEQELIPIPLATQVDRSK